MLTAPIPFNEAERQAALARLDLSPSDVPSQFNHIVRLAQQIAGTRYASFNIIDGDEMHLLARQGLTARQLPRRDAFCAHTIFRNDELEVPDLLDDERFHDHPLVIADPKFRYYFGLPVRTPDGLPVGSLCTLDIVPKKLAEDAKASLRILRALLEGELALRSMSVLDPLTRVFNRAFLEERLDVELRRGRREGTPVSLLLINLDRFRALNTQRGRAAGDEALRSAAMAMLGALRRASEILARASGDEFAVVLPNTPADGAAVVAERILADLERLAIPLDDLNADGGRLTARIGTATAPPDAALSPRELMRAADDALVQAKREGGGRVARSAEASAAATPN